MTDQLYILLVFRIGRYDLTREVVSRRGHDAQRTEEIQCTMVRIVLESLVASIEVGILKMF